MAVSTLDIYRELYAEGKASRQELERMEAIVAQHRKRGKSMDRRRLQSYLDDLARLTVRHGLRLDLVESMTTIEEAIAGWSGYGITVGLDGAVYLGDRAPSDLDGLDPRRLSAHERQRIVAGQFGPVRHD